MNKILNLLGLANRAGKIITGEDMALEAIRNKKAVFVFLAKDAGINTKKRIMDKATYYEIALETGFTSEELSKAIGKENRMVVCLTDSGFAKKIKEIRWVYGKRF